MHWRVGFAFVILAAWAEPADLVWTTLGAGSYVEAASIDLDFKLNRQWAVELKPSAAFTLASIAVPLSASAPGGMLKLTLMADAPGGPGSVIETFSIEGVQAGTPEMYTVNSVLHPRLDAWTEYWIVLEAASGAHITWWSRPALSKNSSSNGIRQAFRDHNGPWSMIWTPNPPGVAIVGTRLPSAARVL
jgi:hypothetical protein